MFDFVHRKRRIVQIILALATLPFLFWGVESYRSNEGEDYVALAAGEKNPASGIRPGDAQSAGKHASHDGREF